MTDENTAADNPAMTDAPQDSAADGSQAVTADGDPANSPAVEKDPNDWVTGDEPMTAPQASYLQTLCQEAGEEFDPSLSKADASRRIDELQAKSPANRGQD